MKNYMYNLDNVYIGLINRINEVEQMTFDIDYKLSDSEVLPIYKLKTDEASEFIDISSGKPIYYCDAPSFAIMEDNLIINKNKFIISFKTFLEYNKIKIDNKSMYGEEIIDLFKKCVGEKNYTKTLAIIKPDAIIHASEIIEMLYQNGLKINKYKISQLNEEILNQHYSHIVEKPFYPKLKKYMMSKPVIIMELKGENAVEKLRELMGPTDSRKASSDTIRGLFGSDITYNAIHGSDSEENAQIEINRFFKEKQKRIIK